MGIFDKVKEMVSDGGITIDASLPNGSSLSAGVFSGSVVISSENPDTVTDVTVNLVREMTSRAGDQTSLNEEQIAHLVLQNVGGVSPEAPLQVPFQLDFRNWLGVSNTQATADEWSESKGGAFAAAGSMLNAATNQSSQTQYKVRVICNVQSRSFSVEKSFPVQLVP